MESEPTRPYLEPTRREPAIVTMEKWTCDGIAGATDGCTVEPDGWCEHGHVSWLLYLGFM